MWEASRPSLRQEEVARREQEVVEERQDQRIQEVAVVVEELRQKTQALEEAEEVVPRPQIRA